MKTFIIALTSILLSSYIALSNEAKLTDSPIARLEGSWIESGAYLQPQKKKSPQEPWIGSFSDDSSHFKITYTDGSYWKFEYNQEKQHYIATRFLDEKAQETLKGVWDAKVEVLSWRGQRMNGGDYIIDIKLPKDGTIHTHSILKNKSGSVDYEWKGQSRPVVGN